MIYNSYFKKFVFVFCLLIVPSTFFSGETQRRGAADLIKEASHIRGNRPQDALLLAEEALKISIETKNIRNTIEAQNIIGSIRLFFGEYEQALILHFKSLELSEKINDPYLLSVTYNNIAMAYQSQKRNDIAIEYFKKSLVYAEKSGTANQILNNLYKLGVIYETLDSLHEAYKYYKRSYLIEENNNNSEGMFYSLLGIGSVCAKRNDYYQSYVIYNKALGIASKLKVMTYRMLVYRHMGELFLREKKYINARQMFMTALDVADSLEYNKEKRDCYINLATTNENLRFYTDAYYYLARYVEINDTIFSQEANERISLMQVKYDLKTKQKEIELLKQKEQKSLIIRNALLIGISLFILVVVLMIYLYRVKMRHNHVLKDRNQEIQQQKEEIFTSLDQLAKVNQQLSQKNQQITESIEYALTIQKTMLPGPDAIRSHFGNAFKVFIPRDIVSGDFYWLHACKNCDMLAVADCTGHGIAGALMSTIANTLMNNIIEENPDISLNDFLNVLNNKTKQLFHSHTHGNQRYDEGMDLSVLKYDKHNKSYEIALANHIACIADENAVRVLEGDIYSVGGVFSKTEEHKYVSYTLKPEKPSTLYMFTDGFHDQLGGPENRKILFSRLQKKLGEIKHLPLATQKEMLLEYLHSWKGKNKQTDDILLIGIELKVQ
ncbi:MAG: hypothetical protein CVU05_12365 [Bacteroidetes bacterium HGW-Bacteroidetes-21]|jgi:serine phosphatase RsbU (regulator of sigma subunit)|nr:MAG: hypothetical protein CVU05_12365 [Bacteroidetes bacterium HGW-Bacteroidetes-21]